MYLLTLHESARIEPIYTKPIKEVRKIRLYNKLAEKELGWKAKAELGKGLKNVYESYVRKYESKYEKERIRLITGLIPPPNSDKKRALDVGSSIGILTKIASSKGYISFGIDVDEEKTKLAQRLNGKRRVEFKVGTAYDLNYPDNFFDLVLCLEVIEHLSNPGRALDEIYRCIKPNGCLIISTPNKLSLEGLKGNIVEKITGKKWKAWCETHQRVFTSLEFIRFLRNKFRPIEIIGYYYFLLEKLTIFDCIKYASFSYKPLNLIGFDIICKCMPLSYIKA